MLFHFTFEGNLAADPELFFTPTGKTGARMRVGHTTRRLAADGEWADGTTTWITVTAWGKLAERAVESFRVGDTVLVEARGLSVWAYLNEQTDKPAGQLQVTAANMALSLRFNAATSRRRPKRPAPVSVAVAVVDRAEDDMWAGTPATVAPRDGDLAPDDQDLYEQALDGQELEPSV